MNRPILGFFLRKEIKTGGHKRYLELLSNLCCLGFNVDVIANRHLDLTDYNFNVIGVKPLKRGGKIPFNIRQGLRILPALFKIKKKSYITLAFGESNYISQLICKLLFKWDVIFAFRSNFYRAYLDELKYYKRDISQKEKRRVKRKLKLENEICKISDLIIFQTEYDKVDITSRNSTKANTAIIPNSINESWFEKKYLKVNNSKELKELFYIGSYNKRKGVPFLLKGINELKKRGYNIKLQCFGYGDESKEYIDYIKENNLQDNITLNGPIKKPMESYGKFDLTIVPSIYDSYPNVILESLYCGTPVIASDNSGMKAILRYDQLVFATGDYLDIADKIENISKNYLTCKELCDNRLKAHNFNWPNRFKDIIIEYFKEN